MTIFQIIMKIIGHFNLLPTEDEQRLNNDVKHWESDNTEDHEDKIKSTYAKIHKGIYVRLALPFVFFFLVKGLKDMISDNDEEFLVDD